MNVGQFEKLNLQVNLSPRERSYFDSLKADLLALFGGRQYDEIKASGEAAKLKQIADKLLQIETFVKTRELPQVDLLTATTPEGREIRFDLAQELKYWTDFYRDQGVDWVTLPESIFVTAKQAKEMIKLMEQGFDKVLIIPENLVDEPISAVDPNWSTPTFVNPKYYKLHELMSKGYSATNAGQKYEDDGFFQGSRDKTLRLRLILTKDVPMLNDDPLFSGTIGKSIEDLEAGELRQFTGFSEATYLVYQREYYFRTKKHLDGINYTWLPESPRPLSGRVAAVSWLPRKEERGQGVLDFSSQERNVRNPRIGCRLARSFELEVAN